MAPTLPFCMDSYPLLQQSTMTIPRRRLREARPYP